MPYKLEQEKQDAIHAWISDVVGSGVSVIWEMPEDDANKPDLPFVTLDVIGGTKPVGNNPSRKYKELDTWNFTFVKRFTLSVSVFTYGNSTVLIESILDSIKLPSKSLHLMNGGLAAWGYDGVYDDSILVDTKWEYRSHADIFLSYGIIREDKPGEIQKINLNGNLIEI